MAVTTYIVTGRIVSVPERYEYPWVLVDLVGIGDEIDFDLDSDVESQLIDAKILIPKAWTLQHTYLR